MIYFFLDEKYGPIDVEKRVIFSCVAFSQRTFSSSEKEARKLKLPGNLSRLQRILDFIKARKGQILIAYADVDRSLIPPRKKDDKLLPGVARNNAYWGAMMTFSIAEMTAILIRKNYPFQTIDVFYDPMSLKDEHRDAIVDGIRKQVAELANDYLHQNPIGLKEKIQYRHIQSVSKVSKTSVETKFQIGTWIADRIVTEYKNLKVLDNVDFITVKDFSYAVTEVFQELDAENDGN